MTTKEYIKKYHLQEENFNLNFDKFLKDFINEFNERIERTIAERKKADLDFGFNIFQNLNYVMYAVNTNASFKFKI